MEDILETVEVSNAQLTKAQLIEKLAVLETAHENTLETLNKERAVSKEQLDYVLEQANKNIAASQKLIAYYERKNKLMLDLLSIEEGAEK